MVIELAFTLHYVLLQRYYGGLEAAWPMASPTTQTAWAMPGRVPVTPGSIDEDALDACYSRHAGHAGTDMSTFGRRAGLKALKQLQQYQLVI